MAERTEHEISMTPATDLAPRLSSADPDTFAVPSGREEQWRFTPLARLAGLHDDASADATLRVEVQAPDGVVHERVGRDDDRVGRNFLPTDRVAARAFAGTTTVDVVTIPAGWSSEAPVSITLTGDGGTSFGHQVIDVRPGANAVVVVSHRGQGVYAGNLEVLVGDEAHLTLISIQEWDDGAVHLGQHHSTIGRDAALRSFVVSLGGDLVRLLPSVEYAAPGGDAELFGLYFADAGQHLEHRLFVEHEQPHCRSNVVYKGALQGEGARTVWIGDVLIRASALGTDTYEMNRNLVLTDGARADSVPNLEIETGEIVGAGHASTTGRFDDEQLFYLQARGIDPETARQMVVRGFFAEILDKISVPGVRSRLLKAVDAELGIDWHDDEHGDVLENLGVSGEVTS